MRKLAVIPGGDSTSPAEQASIQGMRRTLIYLVVCSQADQRVRAAAYSILDFMDLRENMHLLKYEDFIEANLGALEAYLGFELRMDFKVPPRARRILRTGRQGNWRNWFLPEDYDFFVAAEAAKFQRMGYLDERPQYLTQQIDPQEVTGYEVTGYVARVQAILNEPRRGGGRGRRGTPQ